jgi:inner membrane protein
MMFKTHLMVGILAGLLAIKVLTPHNQILFIVLVMFASLLPDIDHPDSKIGSKVKIVGFLFEHRGFFHSLIATILFSVLAYSFLGMIGLQAVAIGYLSHLFADSLTREGIMFLYPLTKRRMNGIFKTGSIAEYVIFFVLVVLNGYALLNL